MSRGAEAEQVDRLLGEALAAASWGLDLEGSEQAVRSAVEAIQKHMERLAKVDYSQETFQDVAKAVGQAVRGLDELVRLLAFARGQPDRRLDVVGGMGRTGPPDWLQLLPDEQVAQVEAWLRAALARPGEAGA